MTVRKLVLSTACMLVAAGSLGAGTCEAAWVEVFSDDFDDETTGGHPSKWHTIEQVPPGPPGVKVSIDDVIYFGPSGKSVRFIDRSGVRGCLIQRDSEPPVGPLVAFEWRERQASLDDFLHFGFQGPGGNVYGLPFAFWGLDPSWPGRRGWLYYDDSDGSHAIEQFEPGRWYHIRMEVDCTTNSFDLLIDGTQRVDDASFPATGWLEAVGHVRFSAGGWSYTPNGAWIDEFVQYAWVADTTPPDITCPPDVQVECDVDYTDPANTGGYATATDNLDPEPEVAYSDEITDPGPCPMVITRTWTAEDDAGLTTTCTQTITIVDTTAPVLSGVPADMTIECDEEVPPPPEVIAQDNCDDEVEVAYEEERTDGGCAGSYELTRTWTAIDDCGNATTATQVITVQDTTPPEMTLNVLKDTLWPPNHKMHLCATVAHVSDACDADPILNISVSSNEPINGPGDGNTDPDWQVVQNGDVWEVWLRAERSGQGSGREYYIEVMVSDGCGNTTEASATVTVAHDQGKK